MSVFDSIKTPRQMSLLVAFFDLTNFTGFSRSQTSQQIFKTLSEYYEFSGDIIETAGGKVIKFIGDAGLMVFAEDDVNRGVLALKSLQDSGDGWLAQHNVPSRNIIKVHFGPVCCGPLGTHIDKRFDIIGETVNIAATLKSNGFAITPQVFRQLDAGTRKLFKKHTPPIIYIPVDEPHKI